MYVSAVGSQATLGPSLLKDRRLNLTPRTAAAPRGRGVCVCRRGPRICISSKLSGGHAAAAAAPEAGKQGLLLQSPGAPVVRENAWVQPRDQLLREGAWQPWKLGPGLEGLLGPRDETIVPHGPSLGVRCGSFQALPAPAPPVVLPFSSSLKRLVAVRQGRHCGSVGLAITCDAHTSECPLKS